MEIKTLQAEILDTERIAERGKMILDLAGQVGKLTEENNSLKQEIEELKQELQSLKTEEKQEDNVEISNT
jgi:regulator of replication initiation timing